MEVGEGAHRHVEPAVHHVGDQLRLVLVGDRLHLDAGPGLQQLNGKVQRIAGAGVPIVELAGALAGGGHQVLQRPER